MRTRVIALVATVVTATYAGETRAGEDTGITLGARLGYGIPMGDSEKSIALSDYASKSIPVVVEAGYRFTKELSAGLYFQYAYANVGGSICKSVPPTMRSSGSYCESGSGRVLRYGLQGAFRLPLQSFTPWVGLGFGAESAEQTAPVHIPALPSISQAFNSDVTVKRSTNIVGEANLSLGAEFTLKPGLSVGPFLTFTLAKYTGADYSPNPWGLSDSIASDNQTWHEWLILGVKGTYDL